MPLMRIGGSQIKLGAIKNEHIGEAIQESKLGINWEAHYNEALQTRKLVDFVQVNGVTVSANSSEVDLTTIGKIPGSDPQAASNDLQTEGVIIDAPKNKAAIRNAATGEPVLAGNNAEVYGRVIFENNAFKLKLFYLNDGTETAFAPGADLVIDFQYARRFNLADIDELFAANEKFVEGSADVTAHLNIVQLAKDIYGAGYSLDRDGNANLATSLVDQIANEVARAQNAESTLQSNINSEAIARQQAITNLITDLASVTAGKGASMIGIEDAAGKFAATTVEAALLELKNDIATLSGSSTTSISELDSRLDAVEAEITAARGTYENLDARLDAIDANITSQAASLQTAIDNEASARQAADSALDGRLTAVEGTLAARKHVHYKYVTTVSAPTSVVNLPEGAPVFVPGNNSLDVYVDGILQEAGVNYAELSNGTGVDFAPEELAAGVKVIFRYYKNE